MTSSGSRPFDRFRSEELLDAIAELIDHARDCASMIAWIQEALERLIEATPQSQEPIISIQEAVRGVGLMVPIVGERLRHAQSDAANIVRIQRRLSAVPVVGRVLFAPSVVGILAISRRALVKTRQASQRQKGTIDLMRESASMTVRMVPAPLWNLVLKGMPEPEQGAFLSQLEYAAGQPVDPNAPVPDDFGRKAVEEMKALNDNLRRMVREMEAENASRGLSASRAR